MLLDTGAAQSFILENVLPFSEQTYSGTDVLIRGMELGCVKVPLHSVYLASDLVSRLVKLGVRERLPVEGVSLIIGNDLVGGRVFPFPVVSTNPELDQFGLAFKFPSVFPACVVTRAQARKYEDVVDLSSLFLRLL